MLLVSSAGASRCTSWPASRTVTTRSCGLDSLIRSPASAPIQPFSPRTKSVGHLTALHSFHHPPPAAASVPSMMSLSNRGHQPSPRCSIPASQAGAVVPKNSEASSKSRIGWGHFSNHRRARSTASGDGPSGLASTITKRSTMCGWRAATSMAACPPSDWPTTYTGCPAEANRSITATASSTWSVRETPGGRGELRPCPR